MQISRSRILWEALSPILGGISLYLLLFIHGLVSSFSISYMGHSSSRVEEYILDNFLFDIIVFIGKILLVYIVIGVISGIVIHLAVFSFSRLLDCEFSKRRAFFLNLIISLIIYLLFFFKSIINFPQVYINNFYNRSSINRSILDFMVDNVSPSLISVLQIVALIAVVGVIVFYLASLRSRIINRFLYALSGIILLSLLFSSFDYSNSGERSTPNVLILASDALRPDHLSGHGYFRKTSPHIDRLITEGVTFRNALVGVPRTFPSWVSFLTGQYAQTHGIRHMFPTSGDLKRDFKSIVTKYREKGYYTAVVADFAGDIFSRIELGFERVDTPYFHFDYLIEQAILENHPFLLPFLTGRAGLTLFPVLRDSAYFCPPYLVRDKIIDALRESSGRPFFLTAFFSTTHFPYSPPYPYYRLYARRDYNGPYRYFKQRVISLENRGEDKISAEDIEQIRSLYDGGIKAFDDAVGDIVSYLEKRDILDNTIIVVLSDHGENLYEGNLGMGHGEHFRGFYSIRIPLIIRYPQLIKRGMVVKRVVRHVDVAPTILSMTGEKMPDWMDGLSLLPMIRDERMRDLYAFGETGIWFDNDQSGELFFQRLRILYPDITFLSEIDFNLDNQLVLRENYRDLINLAKHRYVFDGRYKLIYMPMREGVRYEMYDTLRDPDERNNIAESDQYNFRRLKRILFQWMTRNGDVRIKDDFVLPVGKS
jgi:arylsulfatase A-like enzyme